MVPRTYSEKLLSRELTQHPLHHLGFIFGKPPCSPFQTKIEIWFSSSGSSWFIWILTGHCLFSSLPISSLPQLLSAASHVAVDLGSSLRFCTHMQASPLPGGCVSCVSVGDRTMAPQPCRCLIVILGYPLGLSF